MIRLARAAISASVLLVVMCPGVIAGPAIVLNLRDAAGAAVPEAVISLEGAERGPAAVAATAVVDQRDKEFLPQVTVIRTGTTVRFPNSDAVSHHVYSFAQPNAFELPLYKGDDRPEIRFDHAGIVTLGCNIHDGMLGWIVVVDSPHFGFTDDRGSVVFKDLARGSYQVRVWSPRLDPARVLDAGSIVTGESPASADLSVARRLRSAPSGGGSLADGDY